MFNFIKSLFNKSKKRYYMGVDLDKYYYIGKSISAFTNSKNSHYRSKNYPDNETIRVIEHHIHYFVKKHNHSDRIVKIDTNILFPQYNYINQAYFSKTSDCHKVDLWKNNLSNSDINAVKVVNYITSDTNEFVKSYGKKIMTITHNDKGGVKIVGFEDIDGISIIEKI